MQNDVIGIGLSCVDHLFIRDKQLEPTFHRARQYMVQGGGLAATAMATVGRLGGRCELWTRVGADHPGDFVIEELRGFGVDTSQVVRIPEAQTPVDAVIVDERGERFFNFFPGRGLDRYADEPDYTRIDSARCILIDTHWPEVQARAMRRAREAGTLVVADFEHSDPRSRDLMRLTDVPIVSQECARGLSGSDDPAGALAVLVEYGARTPVVTLGAEGCIFILDGRIDRQRALSVEVVDTTGAGDAFHGAWCYGVAAGWKTRDVIAFASVVASLNCRGLGGRTALPTLEEALAAVRANFPEWNA